MKVGDLAYSKLITKAEPNPYETLKHKLHSRIINKVT